MNETPTTPPFTLYTTSWCSGCWEVKQWLADNDFKAGTDYQEIMVDSDPVAADRLEKINNGYRSVPTLVFADNSTLVEPSLSELIERLKPDSSSS